MRVTGAVARVTSPAAERLPELDDADQRGPFVPRSTIAGLADATT